MDHYENTLRRRLIRAALAEDIGPGDVTCNAILTGDETGSARAVAKAGLVLAGLDTFRETFLAVDPGLSFTALTADGEKSFRARSWRRSPDPSNRSSWRSGPL